MMDYAKTRENVLIALSDIAFGDGDLPAGVQHRIKALEMLFELVKLAGIEDRADEYREICKNQGINLKPEY